MNMSDSKPLACLAPFLGLAIGIAAAPLFAVWLMPDVWRDGWQEEWLPRGAGLSLALFLWTLFVVVARRKKLHCGGTVDMEDEDWVSHYGYLVTFLSIYFGTMAFFILGVLSGFLLCLAISLVVIVGTVGWGSPWQLIKKVRL